MTIEPGDFEELSNANLMAEGFEVLKYDLESADVGGGVYEVGIPGTYVTLRVDVECHMPDVLYKVGRFRKPVAKNNEVIGNRYDVIRNLKWQRGDNSSVYADMDPHFRIELRVPINGVIVGTVYIKGNAGQTQNDGNYGDPKDQIRNNYALFQMSATNVIGPGDCENLGRAVLQEMVNILHDHVTEKSNYDAYEPHPDWEGTEEDLEKARNELQTAFLER